MINLLKKLKPYNKEEIEEYKELLKELENDDNGHYFWYLSGGLDFKPLVYFNETDTNKYQTPTIDFFVYSDYSSDNHKKLQKIYDNEEFEIFEDENTKIEITQMVPLYYYEKDKLKEINSKNKNFHHSMTKQVINEPQFYFMMIEIESNYFDNEYFPILFANMENLELKKIFKKENIKFDYICGICDGCRGGGAVYCVNEDYKKFLDVMNTKKFWITDHSEQDSFEEIQNLYRASYGQAKLYEIKEKKE